MNPRALCAAFFLFILALLCHVILWNFRRPKNQIFSLFSQFIFFPFSLLLIAAWARPLRFSFPPAETLSLCVLYACLAGIYVSTFPAVQTFSPTLVILLLYGPSRRQGFQLEYFKGRLKNEDLIPARIQELIDSKLVKRNGETLVLTRWGKKIALFYSVYRRVLGLPEKGI